MFSLVVLVVCSLFVRINPLQRAYTHGPVAISTRAKLWYSTDGDNVHFAVSVHFGFDLKVNTAQWVGIGIAAPGSVGMRGADLFTAHFPEKGLGCNQAHDRYAPFLKHSYRIQLPSEQNAPIDTQSHQVWFLRNCERYLNGTLLLEVTRLVDATNFPQDVPILPGVTRVLHAYGAGYLNPHGLRNCNSTEVDLLPPSSSSTPTTTFPSDVDGTYTFASGHLRETGESLTCFTSLHNIPDESMVVAISPSVTSRAVVRILLYGCSDTPYFLDNVTFQRRCSLTSYSSGIEKDARCTTLFYSWAPGVAFASIAL